MTLRLPDPDQAATLDDLVAQLRLLKAWARGASYASITRTVNERWERAGRPSSELTTRSTVAGYFTFGRSRLDEELLVAIVLALYPEPEYGERWRRALRAIRGGMTAAALVDVQRTLPAAPAGFVGRGAQLHLLEEVARAGSVVVIHGMAGVGKTWLATWAAHHLPGGGGGNGRVHLIADLRGFDTAAPPADPSAVLAAFLRRLGLRYDQIPRDLIGRIETYRALTREVSVLVILDNAADADSVAPLVPAGRDHIVMVTSRHVLRDLPDAVHVHLTTLDPAESLALLRLTVGAGRVDADIAGALRLATQVGHHPLALSLVGEHLRAHPDWSLDDCARPVTLALAAGARSALAASVRGLPDATGRVLRLLALHPGHDIGCHAVAAIADMTPDAAGAHQAALTDAHLLQKPSAGRYTLHELVRDYAAEQLGLAEPASQVRAALARLFDYYGRTAALAVSWLRQDRHPKDAGAGSRSAADTIEAARQWMAAEYANLLHVTAYAAACGQIALARDLATALGRYQRATSAARIASGTVQLGDQWQEHDRSE
jgi:hypothetical protein